MKTRRSWGWIVVAVSILALSGCRSLTPAVAYYTLGAMPPPTETGVGHDNRPLVSIAIQPVALPGYINRTQMVRQSSAYQLQISSYHRWADYPDRLVQQRIGENLQLLLPHARIVNIPWPTGFKPDLVLSVQITTLIGGDDQKVVLGAVWTLSGSDGAAVMGPIQTALSEPMADRGFSSLAAAHGAVITALCRQMADAIGPFQEKR